MAVTTPRRETRKERPKFNANADNSPADDEAHKDATAQEGQKQVPLKQRVAAGMVNHNRTCRKLERCFTKLSELSDTIAGARVHELDATILKDWSLALDESVEEAQRLSRELARGADGITLRKPSVVALEAPLPEKSRPSPVSPLLSPTTQRLDTGVYHSHTVNRGQPSSRSRVPGRHIGKGLVIPPSQPETVSSALYLMLEAAAQLIGADRGIVWLQSGTELLAVTLYGYHNVRPAEMRCATTEGIVGGCYTSKVALNNFSCTGHQMKCHSTVAKDTKSVTTLYRVWSTLTIPIMHPAKDNVHGVVQLLNKNTGDNDFTNDDECLLWRTSELMAHLLEQYSWVDLTAISYDPSPLHGVVPLPPTNPGLRLHGFDSTKPHRKQLIMRDMDDGDRGITYYEVNGRRMIGVSSNLVEIGHYLKYLEQSWMTAVELNRVLQDELSQQASSSRAAIAVLNNELSASASTIRTMKALLDKRLLGHKYTEEDVGAARKLLEGLQDAREHQPAAAEKDERGEEQQQEDPQRRISYTSTLSTVSRAMTPSFHKPQGCQWHIGDIVTVKTVPAEVEEAFTAAGFGWKAEYHRLPGARGTITGIDVIDRTLEVSFPNGDFVIPVTALESGHGAFYERYLSRHGGLGDLDTVSITSPISAPSRDWSYHMSRGSLAGLAEKVATVTETWNEALKYKGESASADSGHEPDSCPLAPSLHTDGSFEAKPPDSAKSASSSFTRRPSRLALPALGSSQQLKHSGSKPPP
eukprot:Sspe_Gene.59175::Locus_32491_Transcript_1_1_Confidence_1.000_Length_2336::g.59175::m.59175